MLRQEGQVVDIANSSIQSETLVSDDSEKIDDVYGEEFAKEENSKELMLLVEDNQSYVNSCAVYFLRCTGWWKLLTVRRGQARL